LSAPAAVLLRHPSSGGDVDRHRDRGVERPARQSLVPKVQDGTVWRAGRTSLLDGPPMGERSRPMTRPGLLLLATVVLLAGCRAPTPQFDPFSAYGPRRVPPPATGSIQLGDPYFQSGTLAPPAVNVPPPGGPGSAPPVDAGQSLAPIGPPGNSSAPPTVPSRDGSQWQPARTAATAEAPGRRPARLAAGEHPPGAAATARLGTSTSLVWTPPRTIGTGAVRTTSAEIPVESPSGASSTSVAPATLAPVQNSNAVSAAANGTGAGASARSSPAPGRWVEITQLPPPARGAGQVGSLVPTGVGGICCPP
jgi:hypothetical protein